MSRPSRSSIHPSDRPTLPMRRPSISLVKPTPAPPTPPAQPTVQRTSKSNQKLVLLPSEPQTRPLQPADAEEAHGYETEAGVVREHKSAAERMSRAERARAGFARITAYCVAEGFRTKLLASFLKREHNVSPRAFDEALYAMYHLPLLPGYGPAANIRSSAPPVQPELVPVPEPPAPEPSYAASVSPGLGVALPSSAEPAHLAAPLETDEVVVPPPAAEPEPEHEAAVTAAPQPARAEIVFLAYGVVVFFGLSEHEERAVLEDLDAAGIMRRRRPESDWEIEECFYAYDPTIAFPRIYNDFFTLKTPTPLLTLSIAHALAQSTLLAHHESLAHAILSAPGTLAIPRALARTGKLHLGRTDAMKLTGRLFRLRRDVILGTNVLDVPGLFWDAGEGPGPRAVYDRVREYFELAPRVQALNERIAGANDLLDAIHDHLNNNAMERITWIIIWLIVVAILVELGEIVARLVVHATTANSGHAHLSHGEALRLLEGMMLSAG